MIFEESADSPIADTSYSSNALEEVNNMLLMRLLILLEQNDVQTMVLIPTMLLLLYFVDGLH